MPIQVRVGMWSEPGSLEHPPFWLSCTAERCAIVPRRSRYPDKQERNRILC